MPYKVWITPWPQTGTRPVDPGSGISGGETRGQNICRWEDGLIVNINKAVEFGRFYYGRAVTREGIRTTGSSNERIDEYPDSSGNDKKNERTHVITREAAYHPDGGQVVVYYYFKSVRFILRFELIIHRKDR